MAMSMDRRRSLVVTLALVALLAVRPPLGIAAARGGSRAMRTAPGAGAGAGDAGAAPITLEILFDNDIHGYLVPDAHGQGGAGAMAHVIAQARQRAKTDPARGLVVLDSGDLTGGGAEDDLSQGDSSFTYAAGVKYDAVVLGNHDFGFGKDTLSRHLAQLRACGTHVLGANILDAATGQPAADLVEPYCLLDVRGVKVGIVGVTTPGVGNMNDDDDVKGLRFADPTAALNTQIAALKSAGAEVILALSHVGFDNGAYIDDKKLAQKVTGLDAIVGGHSHTLLQQAYVDPRTHVIVVQAGSNGRWMGSLTLTLDGRTHRPLPGTGGAAQFGYVVTTLANVAGSDPLEDVLKAKFWDPLAKVLDAKVATAQVGLYRKFYKVDSSLGDFLADSFLAFVPGAQVALSPASDLRADIPAGDIRLRDLYQAVPFDNSIVSCTVKGARIRALVDESYGNGRHFAEIAGFSVVVDSSKPEGQRVVSMTMNGQPMDDNADYRVATSSFVVEGKGGFKSLTGVPYQTAGAVSREAMRQRMAKLGTINDDAVAVGRQRDLMLEQAIGKTALDMGSSVPSPSANVYDLVTQAMIGSPARGTLALIDTGGIHWKLSPSAPITRRDLFELAPFDSPLLRLSMTGAQLLAVAKGMAAGYQPGRAVLGTLAGAKLVIGSGGDVSLLVADKPIDPSATFSVIVTDHLLTGPHGFESLAALLSSAQSLQVTLRPALESFIKTTGTITAATLGDVPRIVTDSGTASRSATRLGNFGALGGR